MKEPLSEVRALFSASLLLGNWSAYAANTRKATLRAIIPILFLATGAWAQVPNWKAVAGSVSANDWFKIVYDPVAQCTRMWAGGVSIYSNTMSCVKADGTTQRIWTTGNTQAICPSDATIPTDRHPLAMLAVDTKRDLLWMAGGVNQRCWPGVDGTNELYDMWYEVLQSSYNGNNALLTKVTPSGGWDASNYPQETVNGASGAIVYDSDDD